MIALLTMAMAVALFGKTAYAAPMILIQPDGENEETFVPLQRGSVGQDVLMLQENLIANGYRIVEMGQYDLYTEIAVRHYQSVVGFEVTGIADEKTYLRLQEVENFLAIANSRLGCRYVSGGKGPTKFDCSGFVYWALNQSGVEQAYMTSHVWPRNRTYSRIDNMEDLIRGDILCFKGHMGIYLGDGLMINASYSNGKVVIREGSILESRYWRRVFVCGFRVF